MARRLLTLTIEANDAIDEPLAEDLGALAATIAATGARVRLQREARRGCPANEP